MSDTTDTTVDLSKLDEAALQAEYDKLTAAIDTLRGEAKTVENGRAINVLRVQRNAVATAFNEIQALSAEDIEDAPLGASDAGDLVADALADEATAETDAAATAEGADGAQATGDATATDAPAEGATATDDATTGEATADATAADNNAADATADATNADAATAADATEGAAQAAETGRETATTHDVPTTNHGGTPVADSNTPDNTQPSAADEAAVVEAAQQIADGAALAVTAGMQGDHADRPTDGGPGGALSLLDRPKVGWVAGASVQGKKQGDDVTYEEIAQAIRTVQSSVREGYDTGIVASLPSFEATPGMLHTVLNSRMSAVDATALIDETVAAHNEARLARIEGRMVDGITAAICTPLDIIRDVPECGVTDTPFSDIFPQRGIGRLGFQYFPQMALLDTDPNVNIWTEDDQSNIDEGDPSTWKPSPIIECLPAVSVTAEELVASARVDNSTQISQPEQVVQFMHKLAVQRARRREQYLQGKFDALASGYTFTGDYGAMVALLQTGELLERLVYGERLNELDYDLVIEPGHFRKLLLDEDARVFGDTLASRKAGVIAKIKDELGVGSVVVLRDFRTGGGYADLNAPGEAATEMPRLYDANRVRYVPSSAFIFGATGEDSTGWETDPQLTRQNMMQWFSKEWLLLAKHGCHPAAYIDVLSCASGARANGIEPVDCTDQIS